MFYTYIVFTQKLSSLAVLTDNLCTDIARRSAAWLCLLLSKCHLEQSPGDIGAGVQLVNRDVEFQTCRELWRPTPLQSLNQVHCTTINTPTANRQPQMVVRRWPLFIREL